MRNTSVVACVLDCCREFVFKTSQAAQPQLTRGGTELGEHFTLFACGPSDRAYDGRGKHGKDSISPKIMIGPGEFYIENYHSSVTILKITTVLSVRTTKNLTT